MRVALCSVCLVLASVVLTRAEDDPELHKIFNGKDLSGWKVRIKDGVVPKTNLWWHVVDGVLQVRSGPEETGSTLWTERDYTDFVMEFEFRFGEGTVDSGIYVRKSSDQIQIGISGSLKRDMTASPYIAGKGYPVEAKGVGELLRQDGWNSMRIQAQRKHYTVWLNGKEVMTYESDSAIPLGPIGIQLHGNRDMAIDYRDITLAELK